MLASKKHSLEMFDKKEVSDEEAAKDSKLQAAAVAGVESDLAALEDGSLEETIRVVKAPEPPEEIAEEVAEPAKGPGGC